MLQLGKGNQSLHEPIAFINTSLAKERFRWLHVITPLICLGISPLSDCLIIAKDAGLPQPPNDQAVEFCPFKSTDHMTESHYVVSIRSACLSTNLLSS